MARDVVVDTDLADAEPRREGLTNALVIVTALVLLGAFIVMQLALEEHFDAGMFGSGRAGTSGP